jgi:hypothetical protein
MAYRVGKVIDKSLPRIFTDFTDLSFKELHG